MRLFGEEYVKGCANRTGGLTALGLRMTVLTHLLGLLPAYTLRHVLGM
ncbi:hypothetical protein ACIQVT_01705 [Streptomyces sp. NPDC100445]